MIIAGTIEFIFHFVTKTPGDSGLQSQRACWSLPFLSGHYADRGLRTHETSKIGRGDVREYDATDEGCLSLPPGEGGAPQGRRPAWRVTEYPQVWRIFSSPGVYGLTNAITYRP